MAASPKAYVYFFKKLYQLNYTKGNERKKDNLVLMKRNQCYKFISCKSGLNLPGGRNMEKAELGL